MASRSLRFYTITALFGYGISWVSGIYLALIGFRGNPAECSSNCLLGAVPAGLGWILVLVCGHRAFIRFFADNKGANVRRVESLEIGDGPEERRILEILREILGQTRVAKRVRNVETLAWSDMQGWESPRFKWQGYRKATTLVVSAGLRGRLELEDWRTYLRWRYLQHNPRHTWYVARPGILALLPILLFFAVAATLTFSIGQYASALFASIFAPPVLLISGYRLGPAMRKLFLRLDSVAAESLGPMILLSLFKKIDMLLLQENESAKKRVGWTSRLWPEPNITERIANIQSTSIASS